MGSSSFLDLPVELRYLIYQAHDEDVNKSTTVSRENSGLEVMINRVPTLPLQLVSRQVRKEYVDSSRLSMILVVVIESGLLRTTGDTWVRLYENASLQLLRQIRNVEVRTSWKSIMRLSLHRLSVAAQTGCLVGATDFSIWSNGPMYEGLLKWDSTDVKAASWLEEHSAVDLYKAQERLEWRQWTPSREVCEKVARLLRGLGSWCNRNANVTFYLDLDGAVDYDEEHACIFHEQPFRRWRMILSRGLSWVS